ncbi:hypothetical protein D8674_037826 [Pyrus ussuriensis x Pyrus communis]|uniref:Uncharacterized protein n=1 Tax=Pyrus ussuriensis x Pyrus communis TaxID=2448454 RepID=A0A5N5HB99_9ROSA|nr:hypothetical protein D8674_037826 [Pyrus ussuriensis x Pyrus communis]
MGFKPMEFQAKYGRHPSILIEEILEGGFILSKDSSERQSIHSQANLTSQTTSLSMERTEIGSNLDSFVEWPGSKIKRD